MTTDALLEIIRNRGLTVAIKPDGQPTLRGPREEITEKLLKALRWHREEIVKRLQAQPRPPEQATPPPEPDRPAVAGLGEVEFCGPGEYRDPWSEGYNRQTWDRTGIEEIQACVQEISKWNGTAN